MACETEYSFKAQRTVRSDENSSLRTDRVRLRSAVERCTILLGVMGAVGTTASIGQSISCSTVVTAARALMRRSHRCVCCNCWYGRLVRGDGVESAAPARLHLWIQDLCALPPPWGLLGLRYLMRVWQSVHDGDCFATAHCPASMPPTQQSAPHNNTSNELQLQVERAGTCHQPRC